MKLLADATSDVIGIISPPINAPIFGSTSPQEGLIKILNVSLNLVLIVTAIFALFNFIFAGYSYISASGDSKKVAQANQKMLYTLIGIIIVVLAPLIAIVLGVVIFGKWDAIINPNFVKLQ